MTESPRRSLRSAVTVSAMPRLSHASAGLREMLVNGMTATLVGGSPGAASTLRVA